VVVAAGLSLLLRQQIRLPLVLAGQDKSVVVVAPPQLTQRHQQEQSLAVLVEQASLLVGLLPQQLLVQQLVNRLEAVEVEDTSVLET
jgi:hypothetical protein